MGNVQGTYAYDLQILEFSESLEYSLIQLSQIVTVEASAVTKYPKSNDWCIGMLKFLNF